MSWKESLESGWSSLMMKSATGISSAYSDMLSSEDLWLQLHSQVLALE